MVSHLPHRLLEEGITATVGCVQMLVESDWPVYKRVIGFFLASVLMGLQQAFGQSAQHARLLSCKGANSQSWDAGLRFTLPCGLHSFLICVDHAMAAQNAEHRKSQR
ncbi:unnamed protein product [Effrenium voratum]|nr:unnamed protein product [Effrenium voratum]